jgi:hypothetical protein
MCGRPNERYRRTDPCLRLCKRVILIRRRFPEHCRASPGNLPDPEQQPSPKPFPVVVFSAGTSASQFARSAGDSSATVPDQTSRMRQRLRRAEWAGSPEAVMKYTIYEDPVTRKFALLRLPDKFMDGDRLTVLPTEADGSDESSRAVDAMVRVWKRRHHVRCDDAAR